MSGLKKFIEFFLKMTLPNGAEILIKTLLSLNINNNNTTFNKNIRKFARLGIIYVGNNKISSYCPFCYTKNKRCFFTNDNSHYSHSNTCADCLEFKKYLEIFNNNILKLITDFLVTYQVSLNAIYSFKFSKILQYSNPLINIIKKSDLRKQIYLLFENFKSYINKENVGEFCSILVDGASRNLKNFYAFILFTKSRLFYLKIHRVDIPTSENISLITSELINYLMNDLDIEVISICSDHAANMIKAFNACDQVSSQIMTDHFFEWIGCTCHLLNLGISDLNNDIDFQNIKDTLLFILSISQKIEFPHKIPTFSKTRWDSLSKCFNFVFFYKDLILGYLSSLFNDLITKKGMIEQKIQKNQNDISIQNKYANLLNEILQINKHIQILLSKEFEELSILFKYMANTINKIGSDNFLLFNVFPEFIALDNFFKSFSSPIIQKFTKIIFNRILSSNEFLQAATAFFLTIDGKNYIIKNLNENIKDKLISDIKFYLIYYNGCRFGDLEDLLINQIEKYINDETCLSIDPFDYWNRLRLVPEMSRLAEIAIRIINMPCSEAAVERLFSHLKYLYGKKNYQQSDDLLNAQLGIRMENVYSNQEK